MSDEHYPQILIGDRKGDHISITVLGRMHVGASDYWEGNWLVTPVEVVAGDFRGNVGASLRAEELRAFRETLAELNSTLRGNAVLDRPGVGNLLAFNIDGLDVTYLPAVIKSIEEIERAYPVFGTPEENR